MKQKKGCKLNQRQVFQLNATNVLEQGRPGTRRLVLMIEEGQGKSPVANKTFKVCREVTYKAVAI